MGKNRGYSGLFLRLFVPGGILASPGVQTGAVVFVINGLLVV